MAFALIRVCPSRYFEFAGSGAEWAIILRIYGEILMQAIAKMQRAILGVCPPRPIRQLCRSAIRHSDQRTTVQAANMR